MAYAKYGTFSVDNNAKEVDKVYIDSNKEATIIALDGNVVWFNTDNCHSNELNSYYNGGPILANRGLQFFDVDLEAFVNGTNNSGNYQYHANFGAGSAGNTNYDNIEFYVNIIIRQDNSGTDEIGYSIYMQLIGWIGENSTSLWDDSYTNIDGNSYDGEVSRVRLIPRCAIYANYERNQIILSVSLSRRVSDGKLVSINLKDYPTINMYKAVQNMVNGGGNGNVYIYSLGSSQDYNSVLTKYNKDGSVSKQGKNTVTLKSFIPF